MAESASPYSRTETSPLTGPSSLTSAIDPQGLSTVHEVPHQTLHYHNNDSLDNRLQSLTQAPGPSGNASLESSIESRYEEDQADLTARQLRHKTPGTQAAHQARRQSESPANPLQNGHGNRRDMGPSKLPTKPMSPRKEKKSGIRNTLRRMFSRRSTKSRVSVPTPNVYPRHVGPSEKAFVARITLTPPQDPSEFITSATDVVKAKRAASMPVQGVLRTSGLSSHPPHQPLPSPPPVKNIETPPPPERPPPERPTRPRRASVPSLTFSKQEMEVVDAAMTGLGVQPAPEQDTLEVDNIGFAVTNGSNPKRRSRSVGAYRDIEHRMSPIQWRRWRRRSDEIRYWRASSDLTALGLQGLDSPVTLQKDDHDAVDDDHDTHEDHKSNFNFGLPGENEQNQERIGLEERIVTLEIKLMDFEYALSKMQAENKITPRRHSHPVGMGEREESIESYKSTDQPRASFETSGSHRERTSSMSSSYRNKTITPHQRPISIATTLKPGHAGQPAVPRKESMDRSTRSSLAALTIDHYTTLITLLRNEQSARQRLEQEVSILRGRLDAVSPPNSSHSQTYSVSQQPYSHSRSLSSQRRQGFIDLREGKPMRNPRPRSSSYSTTNETDTDDDAFHDVYVTPNITPSERGEYERGAFDRVPVVEEGMAF